MTVHTLLHMNLHGRICGCEEVDGSTCLRPFGHWGPHLILSSSGRYVVWQSNWLCKCPHVKACGNGRCVFSFEIAEAVASVAIADKDWTWAE